MFQAIFKNVDGLQFKNENEHIFRRCGWDENVLNRRRYLVAILTRLSQSLILFKFISHLQTMLILYKMVSISLFL